MKTKVAFLGMGVMGRYMAVNMMQSGIFDTVYVWNRNSQSEGLTLAQRHGCTIETNLSVIGTRCKTICLCLSNQLAVEELFFGTYQLASNLSAGTTILDFSSIGRKATISVALRLSALGVRYIDTPVSGGDDGARNGTLTVMVGARVDECSGLKGLLDIVGSTVFYCGELGHGQAVKSINQLLCSIHMVAVCEAFIAAEKMGLDLKSIVQICSTGAAGSWALSNLGRQIANNNFDPGFMVKHMVKDLLIIQQELASEAVHLPAYTLAAKMFDVTSRLENGNGAELGTQAMYIAYEKL